MMMGHKIVKMMGQEKIVMILGQDEENRMGQDKIVLKLGQDEDCLLYTSPSPRDDNRSRMPSSA